MPHCLCALSQFRLTIDGLVRIDGGISMDWVRVLAYITGTVDQELLLRNEYLAAENRILKAQLNAPLRLTDGERVTLAEIAHRLGRKALEEVANVVKPDTLMGWYRRLVAHKFDGSKSRRYPGRPRIDSQIEHILQRHGIPPAQERERTTTWSDFIRAHLSVLAGTDFFLGRGTDAAWVGHLLRVVLYPSRESSC